MWKEYNWEKTCPTVFSDLLDLANNRQSYKITCGYSSFVFPTSVSFSLSASHPSTLPLLLSTATPNFSFIFIYMCLFSVLNYISVGPPLSHPITSAVYLSFPIFPTAPVSLISLSPSPSPTMLKFSPLHQFALTVNCVENNSRCRAARPGPGFRRIGHDGKGRQPGNCAAGENTEPVQDKAK